MLLESTATVYFEGRNFTLLLERLRKNKVQILKIKKIDDKKTIITVKYKDLKKVFAISQNMWYNKLLKIGGLMGVVKYALKNALFIGLSVCFLFATYFMDNFILGVDINGVSGDKLHKAYKIVSDCGVNLSGINGKVDVNVIKNSIFKNFPEATLITVKKSGYRLIIDLFCGKSPQQIQQNKKIITAQKSGKIIKLTVYSGTTQKSVGDNVLIGETLAEGYYLDKAGNKVETDCVASYTLLCTYKKEYVGDGYNLIAKAMFDAKLDDMYVISTKVTKKLGKNVANTYLVEITYLFQEGY